MLLAAFTQAEGGPGSPGGGPSPASALICRIAALVM
jgi:hypothetical protein